MRYLLFLAFLFLSSTLYAQINNFTGKIIYEYTFQNPETGQDITNQLALDFGLEQHYFINSSNYKAFDENGDFVQSYNSETNKYYFLNPSTDQVMVIDASTKTSDNVEVIHFEDTEIILGKECKKVVVKTTIAETIYYYSEEIRVNPEPFLGHEFGSWSNYIKATNGALPLKYIVKNKEYTWISLATNIERMELTDQEFSPEYLFE